MKSFLQQYCDARRADIESGKISLWDCLIPDPETNPFENTDLIPEAETDAQLKPPFVRRTFENFPSRKERMIDGLAREFSWIDPPDSYEGNPRCPREMALSIAVALNAYCRFKGIAPVQEATDEELKELPSPEEAIKHLRGPYTNKGYEACCVSDAEGSIIASTSFDPGELERATGIRRALNWFWYRYHPDAGLIKN